MPEKNRVNQLIGKSPTRNKCYGIKFRIRQITKVQSY